MTDHREKIIRQIRERAENLYHTHQFFCTESVVVAINEGLGGALSEDQAVAIASGFPLGVGEAGCMCGALSGGILSVGLVLGKNGPYRNRRTVREASGELHDRFKGRFRSTCCRVLTRKVRHTPRIHFEQCAELTGAGAEMAARMILEKRPGLVSQISPARRLRRDSGLAAFFISLGKLFR
ncbi:C_GCAxxG_C_C family protein [Desulfonema ishimotonii]|uniref:C_GCAxxG_C_C family protein n=1 Tax=Desulfonema ishimotonii TaxID=45657 RepID=A0A401G1V7_9BACT|nr:C-GCAxxG-C-C family protein [Desulfonema ishimotonii]GBC63201.1 C_GCAxxG_C_C family protein [Desulfonema ishimotonii]